MTLNNIEERLRLFPEYLQYRLNNWYTTSYGILYTIETMGMMFIGENNSYFDEWLCNHGYEHLAL